MDASLDQALADRGVPYRRGEVIVAVDGQARRDGRRGDRRARIGLPDHAKPCRPHGAAGGYHQGLGARHDVGSDEPVPAQRHGGGRRRERLVATR